MSKVLRRPSKTRLLHNTQTRSKKLKIFFGSLFQIPKATKRHILSWTIFFICLIIIVEFFFYYANIQSWLKPKCHEKRDCTRILLVANPQLIGENNGYFQFLKIFDSDMYLKKTYNLAVDFVRPDIVIFLGSLMEQGAEATEEEFERYTERFFNVFDNKDSITHIWLPGDTDIGGDHFRDLTVEKVERFENAFNQSELTTHKNVTFFKINRLTGKFWPRKNLTPFRNTSILVGLTYMPIIDDPSPLMKKVLKTTSPHVIFTSHVHYSTILIAHPFIHGVQKAIHITPGGINIIECLIRNDLIYEIIVPTCGYSLTTQPTGYGFAIIERDKMKYTVLWSPYRFKQIFMYLLGVMYYVVVNFCFRPYYSTKMATVKNY